jgi:hypothetical protein
MHLLLRTNDLVLLSYVESLLTDAGIEPILLDTHIAAVEGSIGIFPRRVVVAAADANRARMILRTAGLAAELAPEDDT